MLGGSELCGWDEPRNWRGDVNDSLFVRQIFRAWGDVGSVSLRIEPMKG